MSFMTVYRAHMQADASRQSRSARQTAICPVHASRPGRSTARRMQAVWTIRFPCMLFYLPRLSGFQVPGLFMYHSRKHLGRPQKMAGNKKKAERAVRAEKSMPGRKPWACGIFFYSLAARIEDMAGLLLFPRSGCRCSRVAMAISTSSCTSSGVKAPRVTISQSRMVV